jgi:glycosyltransferase involved in cell wall biosynthesis
LESLEHLSGSEIIERLRHLAEDGNEVHLVAAQFSKKGYNHRVSPNLHLVSIPLKYLPVFSPIIYGFALFIFLPIYLVRVCPDFVISDQSTALFLLWKPILAKFLKFKMILDVRSTPVSSGTRVNAIFRSSIWVAKALFDGMTVVTPLMRDEICHTFNIAHDWTGILSNGISEEILSPEKENDNGRILRERLGLAKKFVILYHGSFRLTGGLIESIRAVALIKDKHPNVTLFLLGSSDRQLLDLLRQTIKENKVEENVILHEPVDFHEVPRYIAMSDLGLVPLPNIPFWRYQQPLKLLEYMAMNKAFIVSDSPAHRLVVPDSKNAIYISHVAPLDIATAIEYAYHNRDKLDEWGKVGRDIVMNQYVWKKVNEDFLIYLQSVRLGEKGHATSPANIKRAQNLLFGL